MSIIDSWSGWQGRTARTRASADAASRQDTIPDTFQDTFGIADLLDVPQAAWTDLSGRAVEANAFFHPAWARAVARHAEGKSGARALMVWDGPARTRLIGLLPVVSAWRALRIPIPIFVAWQAYSPLTTPLLDRDMTDVAARGLIAAAAKAGAMALLLPSIADDGPAAGALRRAIASFNLTPFAFGRHERARLDATQDADAAIQTLGAKKVKELRRQRNRLTDLGEVEFKVAAPGAETDAALTSFLSLEASGWKGANGTALACKPGDTLFMKSALPGMVADGAAQIVSLSIGGTAVAAGVVLRHLRRAFFFKIAYDETAAKASPGVQVTLDITRHLCADGAIDDADSTAVTGHPMIDHIWRQRLSVSDLLLPAQPGRPALHLFAALIGLRRVLRDFACKIFKRIKVLKGKCP